MNHTSHSTNAKGSLNNAGGASSAYGGFKNINANANTMTGMLISGSRNHTANIAVHKTIGAEKLLYAQVLEEAFPKSNCYIACLLYFRYL